MKKFDGLLFCTDLDGTLYASDGTVPKANLEAIEYFKSEGGLFTFITGRLPQTASGVYDAVKPNAPYGCVNGAGIYDGEAEKFIWSMDLHGDFIELVRDVDKSLPEIGIQLNTEKEIYINKGNSSMDNFLAVTGIDRVECHYEDVAEPTLKVVFGHDDAEQIAALASLLASHPKAHLFDFIRSERTLYEILPKGASKGTALRKMTELFGIDIAKTVAVGDYNNDISMLKVAGAGFAVANAVPEVKAVADYLTADNNEGAIAAIVDLLDKGKLSL